MTVQVLNVQIKTGNRLFAAAYRRCLELLSRYLFFKRTFTDRVGSGRVIGSVSRTLAGILIFHPAEGRRLSWLVRGEAYHNGRNVGLLHSTHYTVHLPAGSKSRCTTVDVSVESLSPESSEYRTDVTDPALKQHNLPSLEIAKNLTNNRNASSCNVGYVRVRS